MHGSQIELDAVVFGGGAAGLWILDDLTRAGWSTLLLEAGDLGSGQTIGSQGILHGGLKYSLSGLLTASAGAVRDMPLIWRQCLAGEREPDLRGTRLRASNCHLWHLDTIRSRVGMLGARVSLRVAPSRVEEAERPDALAAAPGLVARVAEQVIEPASFLETLARPHRARLLRIDLRSGLEFELDAPGRVATIRLIDPERGAPLDLHARTTIFAAGAGNEGLRRLVGLDAGAGQRRPLHMVLARGDLPELNGHCIDGTTTRVTITTTADSSGRRVWQIGGQIAEVGVAMEPEVLVEHARRELAHALPGLDTAGLEWATYRADRAEAAAGGLRPDDAVVRRDGDVLTVWPTKLVLVPRAADLVRAALAPPTGRPPLGAGGWSRPVVALPPWETEARWHRHRDD